MRYKHVNKKDSVSPIRKLIQLRNGKGLCMLAEKELELLQQNGKNVAGASREFLGSKIEKGPISNFLGMLADKTTHQATLEEIEKAITDGWVCEDLNRKK